MDVFNRLKVGSKAICDKDECTMMLDLSSTFIYGPSTKINAMVKLYGGSFNTDYGLNMVYNVA